MSDPTRLLEDASALTDSARRLLVAGREAAPPNTLGASVWAELAAKLPATGPGSVSPQGGSSSTALGGGGGSAALQSAGVGALLFKVGLAVVGLCALMLGGRAMFFGHEERAPLAKSVLPVTEVAPSPHSVVSGGDGAPLTAEPAREISAVARTLTAHPSGPAHTGKVIVGRAPPVASAASDAREESRLVAAARDALRSGNAKDALGLLVQAGQRFGNGVLGQEREALLIEALSKSGQASAARSHGEAFLSNYARSPYAARVRSIIGDH